MENKSFSSRKMTPEEIKDFHRQRELGDQAAEFESVYRELYPEEWVGFLEGVVMTHHENYEEFVASFDKFSMDDRKRMITRNYRKENTYNPNNY
jgi:hypothetical protein